MHKPEWLSKGAEVLLDEKGSKKPYDVIIVGSGYGGAVAAARLAQLQDKDGNALKVCVLERGREHLPGTFPSSFSELPGHVRFSRSDDPVAKGVREGLFDLRVGSDVTVLVASGLGGGSLINAGVLAEPALDVFDANWPRIIRDELGGKKSLLTYYQSARERLEAHEARTEKHDKPTETLEKHTQFVQFTGKLGAKAEKASITVDPAKCVQCGDCATGCNVGAKNTLGKTYLHTAWQYKAEIYTGATVSHVEKDRGEWVVHVALTAAPRPLQKETLHAIRARNVILAAGALGSTEILMRSKERCREIRLSKRLGARFSTNGDMISAFYAPSSKANAAAEESRELGKRYVGPTITGIAHSGKKRAKRIVIEELAIPGALRRIFEEVVTISVMLDRLGRRDTEPHRPLSEHDPAAAGGEPVDSGNAVDPAAVDTDAIDCTQVFAAMGDDGAKGELELVPGWNDPAHAGRVHDGAIRVHWPKAGQQEVYKEQDRLLSKMETSGATYLRNPLWQPLPGSLSGSLSGAMPTGMLFSVHPLGGCPMADDVERGVVDHMGRVFDATTASGFHEGLLVLDGSIIPSALGVNPLLTITALAQRAIDRYAEDRKWTEKDRRKAPPRDPRPQPVLPHVLAKPAVTAVRFAERMTGGLSLDGGASKAEESELTLQFDPVDNLACFLRKPLHPLTVSGKLQIGDQKAEVTGLVELLVRGASKPAERIWRALSSYWCARGPADAVGKVREKLLPLTWQKLWQYWRDSRIGQIASAIWAGLRALRRGKVQALLAFLDSFELGKGYVHLASNVGEIRYLFYEFTLLEPLTDPAGMVLPADTTKIRGRKTLKYAAGTNPWRQLTDLELTAVPADGRPPVRLGTLTVDPAYFFRGFESQLQITEQRDLPAALMDLASLALFVARIVLKIHFWSFRLPEYQKYDPMRDVRRLPGHLTGLMMERHVVGYPETPRDAGVFLPITRYRASKDCRRGPVVLFHGLGSGGIQFATPNVEPNMAQHLAAEGFDVWVAELRTSIALPSSLDQWTLDEVAREDIPRIIDLVLDKTGYRRTRVVAHCIGSAMFCTAVLDGRLQHPSGESKIRGAVLLQVGPLITLSKGTRLRGLVAAPLRRFFPTGHVDFSVDDRAGWVEAMIDRLLATYPYPREEAEHHQLGWSWKRNSHIANCNRWAAIDGRMFQHDNLSRKMLGRLGEVLGHSSLTTWAQTIQYAFLERLTDSEAKNSYVTAENVRDYFRFPVCFMHGSENDVFHPLTSYRSHELLKRVHGSAFPAFVRILPGYGHFDPLIGKYAETHVFQFISRFLKKAPRVRHAIRQKPATGYYFRRPLVGPVLGWVRQDDPAVPWHARIWCRLDDLRSPVASVLVQVFKEGKWLRSRVVACPTRPEAGDRIESLLVGPIDTTLCIDMELGREPGPYEVVVLSLHEALADPVSEEHRQAEISAGKRSSASGPHLPPDDRQSLAQRLEKPAQLVDYRALARGAQPEKAGYDEKIDCATVTVPEPAKRGEALTIALASCRYPGWMVDRGQADAIFGEIAALPKDQPKLAAPSALFLVGDQIYADATAGAFDPKDRRERFYEAYREAWTAPNARNVLSRIPAYMMMDDHEAGDNWHPQDALGPEEQAMRRHGIEAFKHYQWIHSPGKWGRPKASADAPEIFDYSFELQGFPVFVCDTRSGREGPERMLDAKQFKALTDWLERTQKELGDHPKLVVSPSPVVPFAQGFAVPAYAGRFDGWDGFRGQLSRLLGFICETPIDNVVFLCGDSHLSMCSEMEFQRQGQRGPSAYCIVSSPMYAPYPFANSRQDEYVDAAVMELPEIDGVMRYTVAKGSWIGQDSFAHLSIQKTGGRWRIDIHAIGVGGKVLAHTSFPSADAATRSAVLASAA